MWVYPESQNTPTEEVSPLQLTSVPPAIESAPEMPQKALVQDIPSPKKETTIILPKRLRNDCWLLAAAFLIGSAAAGVLQAGCNESEWEILRYYLSNWSDSLSVTDASGAAVLFRAEYLTLALFSSMVLLLGFSAFGNQLIFLLMMFYGMGSGILLVQLCTGGEWRTMLVIALSIGIPAALAEGVLCLFGASALRMSGMLQRSVFHREKGITFGAGTLMGRYLLTLVVFAPLCGLCTGLSFLIAAL